MTSGREISFSEIKSFIEKNNCKLLEEEKNIKTKDYISLQCNCGNIFVTNFDKFKNQNKRICNQCSRKVVGNKLKLNFSIVLSKINEANYTYISGDYFKKTERNLILKDNLDYFYSCSLTEVDIAIKNNGRLERFSKTNSFTIQNIKNWLQINNKKFILLSDFYQHSHTRNLEFLCLICNEKWAGCWANISQGQGCPYCAGRKIGSNNSFGILFPDLLKEWDYKLNTINPYEISVHTHKNIYWVCKICNNSWKTRPSKRVLENTGCPNCVSSKGEKIVCDYLDLNNIIYKKQYYFKDCKISKRVLSFDFYIPNKNIIIEYQGIQHYEPVDFAGEGEEFSLNLFNKNQIRDDYKRKYCKDNKINLIEIPYWEIDNIPKYLENILCPVL